VARERWAIGLASGSVLWGLALVAGAFVVPVYSGETASSSGVIAHSSATLVAVNGLWIAGLVAVPAVLAVCAWLGLQRACAHGSRAGRVLAWACVALLAVFAVLGAASIGMFVLPAVLLLAAGARLTPLSD
jgi:hypothetical protein